jgi:Flp pilus assembly protein TadG
MRLRSKREHRSGATMAETGIVMLTFLIAVVGMIDVGTAVLRQHTITEAARYGARLASVHGQNAPTTSTSPWDSNSRWGPSQIGPMTASTSGTPIVNEMRTNYLSGIIDPSNTTITVTWPDSSNAVEKRVRVNVQYTYTPMLTLIFGANFTLSATSTMQIAH